MLGPDRTIAIVGAGQAGAWVAQTLRSEGFAGRIVLFGAEAWPPYERPPLSKSVLTDPATRDQAFLLTSNKASEIEVELRLGTRVVAIDREARLLTCEPGEPLHYDRLFLTTGSAPRWPEWAPAIGSPRIHALRTMDDSDRLREALAGGGSLLIVGGGWIGLEVAASARKMGVTVEILEAADRLCARSLPAEVSDRLAAMHRDHGVWIRLGVRIVAAREDQAGAWLEFVDGTTARADHILIGIGNVPETALATQAGLAVADGIVVDAAGRTSDPLIYAAGDATCFPCTSAGRLARRESWANAQNQAIVAAKAAMGLDVAYDDVAWIWSDQYDANIQIVGAPERAATLLLKPGKAGNDGSWLALDEQGRPVGAVAINAPRDVRAARKLIQSREPVDADAWV